MILIGGHSTRMGQDKASLSWNQGSLLDHQISLLQPHCSEIFLSTNANQMADLGKMYNCIEDSYIRIGPMGGITTALETLQCNLIVVPVDMPHISSKTLTKLIDSKIHCCYELQGRLEPFPSYWTPELIKPLKETIVDKDYSISNFVRTNSFKIVPTDRSKDFKNMNTPFDLQ